MTAANAVVAAVQATPVFLDREATVDRACELTATAAAAGASLVVFPEAFVPGYPDWVWRTPAWSDGKLTGRLLANAVEVPSPSVDRLGAAAAEAGVYLAIGVNEAVSGLICWENYMPLARAAVYALGTDVYLAPTWDNSDTWVATLQHIAKEGRVYVVGVAPLLHGGHVPADLRGDLYQDDGDWMSRGHSTIVEPGGRILAGPVTEREEILYAEIDPAVIAANRRQFDPVGHYSRPDVFRLEVDTTARRPVTFRSA